MITLRSNFPRDVLVMMYHFLLFHCFFRCFQNAKEKSTLHQVFLSILWISVGILQMTRLRLLCLNSFHL